MLRTALSVLILVLVLSLCGCAAFKEGSKNVGQTVADASYNTYQAIKRADNWFKENYW